MSEFKDELEDLLDREIKSWQFYGEDGAVVFIPDEAPVSSVTMDGLRRLDEEYDIVDVQAHSSGRTGAKLAIELGDIVHS